MAGLNLSLHKNQLKVFHSKARVKSLACGRGFGKTYLALISAIAFCISYTGYINPASPQIVLIVCPTLKMSRTLFWKPLKNLLENSPIVHKIDNSDFRIIFKGERPDLVIRGADLAGDRLRGLNVVFAICDEFADFHPDVWPVVLKPALTRNKDWKALCIGTPRGKSNFFFKFCEEAKAFNDYEYFHYVTADNPFIQRSEIERARRELPPKVFRQEMESSFEDFDGQLFPNLGQHHKVDIIPNQFRSVMLGADWGDVNPFLTVIGVTHTGEYYMIDRFRSDGSIPITEDEIKDLTANFERLYGIYRCYLPDDRPASILSFRRYGKQHGLKGMQRSVQVQRGKPGVMERALIINSLFYQNRLFFGPKCHDMYDEFESYHRAKDRLGNLLSEPAKGQKDHSVDSVAYPLGQIEGKYIQNKAA